MIVEFERRLADVLGPRLPAPFTGRVDVLPGNLAGNGPSILVNVAQASVVEGSFGEHRPEVVPGANSARRVLRLSCDVNFDISPQSAQTGRLQQMQGLDAVMYALDAPDFRTGQALASGAPPDPGFFIQSMLLTAGVIAPVENSAELIVRAQAQVQGWFWPVGVAGQTGVVIDSIRLRGVALPLAVSPANPRLVAGGQAVELTVSIGAGSFGTYQLLNQPILPFGSLVFSVLGAGARPGKGTLVGAVNGIVIAPVTDGVASVSYTPPDEATSEELILSLEDGEGGAGIEIGRFNLIVRNA